IVDEALLVYVESGANSNKFYRLRLNDDGSVHKLWGRVRDGAELTGQSQTEQAAVPASTASSRRRPARATPASRSQTPSAPAPPLPPRRSCATPRPRPLPVAAPTRSSPPSSTVWSPRTSTTSCRAPAA